MAKALLRARMAAESCELRVASAGFLEPGLEPPVEVVDALSNKGVDLAGHRSRQVSAELVRAADLVVTMTRQHLIEVITTAPDAWEHCFTLVELVQRAESAGPRQSGEDVDTWVRRLHGWRTRASLLSLSLADDVADPMGGRPVDFERLADHLEDLIDRLVVLAT